MKKKMELNLPFTTQKGGDKRSFKILNEKDISNNLKNTNIINYVKKMIFSSNMLNNNKINYIKGSNTKLYYKEINKK